jgi:hypothetical protein
MNASARIASSVLTLILCTVLATACATFQPGPGEPYGGGPINDALCSQMVSFDGDVPPDARWAVDRACDRFSQSFDLPVEVLAAVLQDLEIRLIRLGQFEQCAERGRSCTSRTRTEINMESVYWRSIIMHEVTHVLLLYFEPELPPHHHHTYMQARGLCYRGCTPSPLFEVAAGIH